MKNTYLSIVFLLFSSIIFGQSTCYNGPDSLQVNVSGNDASCSGNCDGFAYVTANYGSGFYTYSWTSSTGFNSTQQTVGGLCAGDYYASVTDVLTGITCTDTFTVNEPFPLVSVWTSQPTSCQNTCDGLLILSASGGTGPYLFSLDGTTWSPNQTYPNLCEGTYNYYVQDANGCMYQDTYTIFSFGVELNSASSTNETTTGASDGTVTISASNGQSPYTYTIDGSTYQGSNTFTGLSAGTYYPCVMDANGCIDCDTVVVGLDSATCNITATYNITPESCPGSCDGSITVFPFGGTMPYIMILDGTTTITATTVGTFYGVCAGAHQIDIIDNNGCTFFIPAVTVWSNSPVTISHDGMTNETAPGASDGTLSFSANGGTSPYTFSLTGFSSNTSGDFTGLSNGWYEICVTDANGCQNCDSAYIGLDTAGCVLTATHNEIWTSCPSSCDGQLHVYPFGGTIPYIVTITEWNTGNQTTQTATTVALFNGLCAGVYSIDIVDNNGCNFSFNTQLMSYSNLNLIHNGTTNETSSGANDGTASFSGNGGQAPYSYNLGGNINSTGNFTGLASGWYSICLTDSLGCQDCDSTYIGLDTAACNIQAYPQIVQNVSGTNCDGMLDGTVTGSTTYNAYWIDCNTGNIVYTAPQYFNVCPGNYALVAQDYNTGCTDTSSCVTLFDSSACNINATYSANNESCPNSCDGLIIVYPIGGTMPYTVTVGNQTQTVSTAGTFPNLCGGVYQINIVDAMGCTYFIPAVTIGTNSNLTLNHVGMTNETVTGANDGTLSFSGSNGVAPYMFNLNGNINSTGNFTGLASGWYSICLSDTSGCQVCDSAYVGLDSVACGTIVSTANQQNTTCGECNGIIYPYSTGGVGPYTYYLNGQLTTAPFYNLCSGFYVIDVVDANGCYGQPYTVWIDTSSSSVTQTITGTSNETGAGNQDGTISVTGSSQYPNIQYYINGSGPNTTGNFTGLSSGWYWICSNDGFCEDCDSVYVGLDSTGCNFSFNPIAFNETCPGQCNGYIQVDVFGGTPPYILQLNGPQSQTITVTANTGYFQSLCPGVYQISGYDNNGCQFFIPALTIGTSSTFSATASVTQHAYGNCDGIVDASTSGGVGPYSYEWYDCTTGNLIGNSQQMSNLCGGSYYAMVIDHGFGNCIDTTDCVTVLDSAVNCNISVTPNLINQPSTGQCDGYMDATVTGTSTYNVWWVDCTTGQIVWTTPQFQNLCAGSYYAVVHDYNTGCIDSSSCITVTEAGCNHQVLENIIHASCAGNCDGSIYTTTTGSPIAFVWDNGATTPSITGLCPGIYCLTIYYADSCESTYCYTVTSNSTLALSSQINNESSSGAQDGLIVLTGSGGTPGYEFSIDNGTTWVGGTNPVTFGNLSTGGYMVCVRDSAGCELCDSIFVGVGTGLSDGVFENVNIYPNPSVGQLTIDLGVAFNGGYSISLSDPTGRLIWQENKSSTSVQLDLLSFGLSRGMYVITLQQEAQRVVKRVILD